LSEDSRVKQAWYGGIAFAVLFTVIIWFVGPNLIRFTSILLPDQGATWYYWKLPERNSTGMLITWGLYLAHQFSIWWTIYWAQNNLKEFRARPSPTLTKYNLWSLGINAVFITLHLVQTQLTFDGLAQDVPIWTSQGSVIIMLAEVLILENGRRGFIVGKKLGRPFTPRVVAFIRRSHQYVFAWAFVYTFWFHPMAVDPQLLSGFLYMFLLFLQVSLAYTEVHLWKRWIVTLESYVALHAFVVAVYNTLQHGSPDMWPMFFAGFAFMFVFTYQYAIGLSKRGEQLVTVFYALFLVWLYAPFGLNRGFEYLQRAEFLWIPIILYLLAIAIAGGVYIAQSLVKKK
jgi:hypothetical protein